jgi:uncharacterized protein with ATP-grasp and redox domains
MECNIKQLVKLSKLLDAPLEKQEEASKKLFKMLSNISYEYSNPYIMGETWKIVTETYNNLNPYRETKSKFNQLLLSLYDDTKELVEKSLNPLESSLKTAVVGNIIDFGARHKFTKYDVLERLKNYDEIIFNKDDSRKLIKNLLSAKTLLYIGDNCGEIVLDKLFIEQIKKKNPQIDVHFGVRGKPILNDVTIEDANEVNIEEFATVVSSGMQVPGTIIEETNDDFKKLFYESDIVIAKGQGNFESLSDTKRDNLYLMLMAKCDYVAKTIGCKTMDYVVIENN